MKSGIIIAGCLILTLLVKAQDFEIKQYSVADGLPHSVISSIVEDSLGYLWIGTDGGGLSRFDGKDFVNYKVQDGLLSNFIEDLYIDRDHALWIIQSTGISKFYKNRFLNFPISAEIGNPGLLERSHLIALNDTLIYTSRQLITFKIFKDSLISRNASPQTREEATVIEQTIRDLYQRKIKANNTLSKQDADHLEVIFGSVHPPSIRTIDDYCLIQRYDSAYIVVDNTIYSYMLLPGEEVLFFERSSGRIWSKTNQNSLMIRDQKREQYEIVNNASLSGTQVRRVRRDSEGNIWIGTFGRGLMKYYAPFLIKYDAQYENRDIVFAIEQDENNNLVVGTSNSGLKVYNSKKELIRHLDFRDPDKNQVASIKQDLSGNLWVGTYGGLAKLDKNYNLLNWWNTDNGLPHIRINAIETDNAGNLYLATRGGGLFVFNGERFFHYDISKGLLSNVVWSCRFNSDTNVLYICTANGLNVMQGTTIQPFPLHDMNPGAVLSAYHQNNFLVLGTLSNGLYLVDLKRKLTHNISIDQGLSSNLNYFVLQDLNHDIWVGTERGIDFIKMNWDKLYPENIIHLDAHSGFGGAETNLNSYKLSTQGDLWFGSIDGLYKLNKKVDVSVGSMKPHFVAVENPVTKSGLNQFANEAIGFFNIPVYPILPYTSNHIKFEFNNVSKSMPYEFRYTYKLEGFDPIWSEPLMEKAAIYYNLKPGNYTFYVAIAGTKQVILTYPFTITPPFYHRPLFLIGLGMTVLCIVGYTIYTRTKHKVRSAVLAEKIRHEEHTAIRREISRDFHDEMGTYLSRIIMHVSLMKMNGLGKTTHHSTLQKIEESAKYLHKGTRDFIWASDPINDFSQSVYYHLVDFAKDLFSSERHYFRSFYLCTYNYQLLPGYSRQITLIFKEAMHNAYKHSKGENFDLHLQCHSDQLEFRFEDDGVGFIEQNLKKISGIHNIRLRAKKMEATVHISQRPKGGTEVILIIPVKNLKAYVLDKKKGPHN